MELWNHRTVSSGLRLWVVGPELHLALDPSKADIRVMVETLAPHGMLVVDHVEGSDNEGCSAQVLRPPGRGQDCLVIRLGAAGTPQYAAFCSSLDEVLTGLLEWVADPRRLPDGPSFEPVRQAGRTDSAEDPT